MIYIVECRNQRRDVITYSVDASSEAEAQDIFEVMKNKGETFIKIRETLTKYNYSKDKI